MNNKMVLPTAFAASISLLYICISCVLIGSIYYLVPVMSQTFVGFYKSIGADLPSLTLLVLNFFEFSYNFVLFVLFFAVLFYFKNLKLALSIKTFIYLNISLLICIAWYGLVLFALQIPIYQMSILQ